MYVCCVDGAHVATSVSSHRTYVYDPMTIPVGSIGAEEASGEPVQEPLGQRERGPFRVVAGGSFLRVG
jgi:hypothetical protein